MNGSTTAGVYAACAKLRETVAQKLVLDALKSEFIDGQVLVGKRSVPLVQGAQDFEIAAEDAIEFGDLDDKNRLFSFGGELGLCGVPAAIANAIYNATGVRVRDYPITLDKLLDRLPAA